MENPEEVRLDGICTFGRSIEQLQQKKCVWFSDDGRPGMGEATLEVLRQQIQEWILLLLMLLLSLDMMCDLMGRVSMRRCFANDRVCIEVQAGGLSARWTVSLLVPCDGYHGHGHPGRHSLHCQQLRVLCLQQREMPSDPCAFLPENRNSLMQHARLDVDCVSACTVLESGTILLILVFSACWVCTVVPRRNMIAEMHEMKTVLSAVVNFCSR